jgi:hypothetical protein
MNLQEAYAICKQHEHRYVALQMKDGCTYDGIMEQVDEKNAYLAVPQSSITPPVHTSESNRSLAYTSNDCDYPLARYPYPSYPYAYHYGYSYGNPYSYSYGHPYGTTYPSTYYPYSYGYPNAWAYRPRFYRRMFPLANLLALSLLPYY